jgi:hypothetical protein
LLAVVVNIDSKSGVAMTLLHDDMFFPVGLGVAMNRKNDQMEGNEALIKRSVISHSHTLMLVNLQVGKKLEFELCRLHKSPVIRRARIRDSR